MIIIYLLSVAHTIQSCTIQGKLYTPKQFPAQKVIVTFNEKYSNTSEADGSFLIACDNNHGIKGSLKFNLANQFYMEQFIDSNASTYDCGIIILDNHQTIHTTISGCIENPLNYQITATYKYPTLLDVQILKTNGCFTIEDELMKLMIIEVFIEIQSPGYITQQICANSICNGCECENGISLFNTYNYTIQQPIVLKPKYIDVYIYFIINYIQLTQNNNQEEEVKIGISCQQPTQLSFIDTTFERNLFYNETFKEDIKYTCGVLAIHREYGIDSQVFHLQQNQTIYLNLEGINKQVKNSIVRSQVITIDNQPIVDSSIEYNCGILKGIVKSDSQGNFNISLKLQEKCQLLLTITKIGYEDLKFQIESPQPPFVLNLAAFKMNKLNESYKLELKFQGKIESNFGDAVGQGDIILQCQSKSFTEQTDDQGVFKGQLDIETSGENCEFTVKHKDFEQFQTNIEVNQNGVINKYMKGSIDQQGDITVINVIVNAITLNLLEKMLTIQGEFKKQLNGEIDLWLNRAFYLESQLASPKMNQTLRLSHIERIEQQSLFKYTVKVFRYYEYEILLQLQEDGKSYTQVKKNSTDDDELLDFGVIEQGGNGKIIFSIYYTNFIGRVVNMEDNTEGVDGVEIDFYYQFVNNEFINSNSTNSDGIFNLLVGNPRVEGEYNGLVQFKKDGFVGNDLQLTFQAEKRNQTLQIGTIQMIQLQ